MPACSNVLFFDDALRPIVPTLARVGFRQELSSANIRAIVRGRLTSFVSFPKQAPMLETIHVGQRSWKRVCCRSVLFIIALRCNGVPHWPGEASPRNPIFLGDGARRAGVCAESEAAGLHSNAAGHVIAVAMPNGTRHFGHVSWSFASHRCKSSCVFCSCCNFPGHVPRQAMQRFAKT